MLRSLQKSLPGGLALFSLIPVVFLLRQKKKKSLSQLPSSSSSSASLEVKKSEEAVRRITILYGTTTGTSRSMAKQFAKRLSAIEGVAVEVYDMATYNTDLMNDEDILLLLCSTWTGGLLPETAQPFLDELEDLVHDFRVSKDLLGKVQYAVFGLGGDVYSEHFCTAAYRVHKAISELGGKSMMTPVCGDDQSDLEEKFDNWCVRIESEIIPTIESRLIAKQKQEKKKANTTSKSYQSKGVDYATPESNKSSKGKLKKIKGSVRERKRAAYKEAKAKGEVPDHPNRHEHKSHQSSSDVMEREKKNKLESKSDNANDKDEMEEEDLINDQFCRDSEDEEEAGSSEKRKNENMTDLEDLGVSSASSNTVESSGEREMVTKLQRKSLVKEGYKIIGSHSAVKICRWTKNQMRGRGGCYKHSFYGIVSYQCMEATPSLACANKCVFCWRHHKNPVGTSWRWKTDEPSMIVSEAVGEHVKMVNQMKGVPGVLPERFKAAKTVRHCALSLVGEPIMYPRINEMVRDLHSREISTFLVTNAQFPEEIANMDPVTQLYVSVDAASSESMKAVDRPLFKDFWQRFKVSLQHMKEKQQRTVYRMTLVKSWNMDEVAEYAELIEEGEPDFIEIKAVTYCGKSDASNLTMDNVPWHHEVCKYAEAIVSKLTSRGARVAYGLASEHQHSCCILIARKDKFLIDGVWHTWIDYPKFHQLIGEYYSSGGSKQFVSTDYMAETPAWALYQSEERGFDPKENRWKRNKAGELVEINYKSTDSGCG